MKKTPSIWFCVDCNKNCINDDKDYYMVKNNLWKKIGVGEKMLCMDCLESRIGRKLIKKDILVCPLTNQFKTKNKNGHSKNYQCL